jgi:hypothetical protein
MRHELTNWSLIIGDNPYQAPENNVTCLYGIRVNDGKIIQTSYIVSSSGREVTTYSGSVYVLKDIDPNYLKWMSDHNIKYNPENPISWRKFNIKN